MVKNDLGGLGDSDTPVKDEEQNKLKRRKLRHYDLLPGQVLNPMGASGIDDADLDRLWRLMGTGNKACEFFSELCDEDTSRHRVAISRMCQVLCEAIETLETEAAKKVIKDKLYAAAKKNGKL